MLLVTLLEVEVDLQLHDRVVDQQVQKMYYMVQDTVYLLLDSLHPRKKDIVQFPPGNKVSGMVPVLRKKQLLKNQIINISHYFLNSQ